MKKALFVAAGLALCSLLLFGLFRISKSRTFQFFGQSTSRVETDKKVVALTFDDAPTAYTDDVLDVLAEKGIVATFYVIGSQLAEYPEAGKRIVAQGNELGNHSFSHQRFLLKSQAFINREITSTNALIREAGFSGDITFRPPYGKKLIGLPWYLMRHGIETVMWDVEPDSYGSGTDFLVQYTVENTKNGSIILLHPFCESCENDRNAIPLIIDELQNRGFTFLTISELLALRKDR